MNNLLFLRERTLPEWRTVGQTTHKMHNLVCNSKSLSIIENKMFPLIRFAVELGESVIDWSEEVKN